MKDFSKHIIKTSATIKDALERLNNLGVYLTLFVVEEERLVGTITDGDIRRGLVAGLNLTDKIQSCMNTKFKYLQRNNYSIKVLDEFRKKNIHIIPVVDDDFKIIKLINLSDLKSILPVDGVIMAGGLGERLKPLTIDTPKPLLKVGDKPLIEHNVDRLIKFGVDTINISIRHLGNLVEDHFGDGSSRDIRINYTKETTPLGTIGSIKLIEKFNHENLLIMNADLLTNIDFEDFYKQFEADNAFMCVAATPYKVTVPYAVLEMSNNEIVSLKEKPTYTYYSSAGIYLLKKEAIKYIPSDKPFHATDLIESLIADKQKVTTYPILEYWLDVGKPDDFVKAHEDIKHIKL